MTKSPITDIEFIAMVNAADNAADVAKALGISPQAVSKRAQLLRDKGHDVKVFPRGGKRKGAGQKSNGFIRTAVQVSFLSEWERDEYMKLSPYQRAAFALAWAQE
jgi:DNA-binding Lrp family transcriptional regulator